MRRSLAIGQSLTKQDVEALIAACERLISERAEIERTLADLGPRWADVRACLNRLHRLMSSE